MIGQQDFDIEIVRKWFTNRSTIGELFGWDVFDNRVKQMCYTSKMKHGHQELRFPHSPVFRKGNTK
jgi:hypothetical protein